MYREEYERGGFVMWSNDDVDGARTSRLAVLFSIALVVLPVYPVLCGVTRWWFLIPGMALGAVMLWLAWCFRRSRDRRDARRLFFYTLVYLPLALLAALSAWMTLA